MSSFQKGFVSQLLLVLLLAGGITAGTLLVQNRTNFLPKADTECTQDEKNSCTDEGTTCKVKDNYHLCIDPQGKFCIGNSVYTSQDTIGKPSAICGQNYNSRDMTQNPKCGYYFDGTGNQQVYSCMTEERYNKWAKNTADNAVRAGRPAPGGCKPEDYKSKCGGRGSCYQNSSGNPVCLLEGTTCTPAQQQSCKDKYGLENCNIVGGEVRCIYPPNQPCNKNETCPSGSACKVVVRRYNGTDYRISECTAKCNDGWWNYCAIAYKLGCKEDSQGVPECTGAMAPRSVAQKPALAAPGGDAPAAPAAGKAPNPALSSGAQAANTTTPAGATSADCGYEYNGTRIPCYKIGVFDDKTRQQIEQNAKIASENYVLYDRVLKELISYMDTKAAASASATLAAAKAAAAACIK